MTDTYVEKLITEKFLTIGSLENVPKAIQYYENNKNSEEPLKAFEIFMPIYPTGASEEDKKRIDGLNIRKFIDWVELYGNYYQTNEGDLDDDALYDAVKVTDIELTTINHSIKLYNENGEFEDYLLYPNVAFPNEDFTRPLDKNGNNTYWYELYFIANAPNQIELGTTGRSRWTGIMQINICLPKTWGTEELYDRFDEVAALFRSGLIIEGVRIVRTYRSVSLDSDDYYCLPVTIEWWSDLDR